MPHMLAQEHMGFVDALRYGTARTQATIAAALSAISSATAILVLTMVEDGIWALASNITIPANVTLWIPAGVTVNRATGVTLTISGPLVSFHPGWETGVGTTVRNPATDTYTEFTRVVASFGVNAPFSGVCYVGGASGSRQVIIDTSVSPGNAVINFVQPTFTTWGVGSNVAGQWFVNHPGGGARIVLTDAGCGLDNAATGVTPTHALHLFQDDAFKATANWSVPSDERLKTVVEPYADGLETVLALPGPVVYTWNGKAQTPNDGKEYIGMLAQDVEPVAPYLISTYQDKLEPEDPTPTTIYSMNSSPLVYMLINAVKEQQDLITALTARVETLENP